MNVCQDCISLIRTQFNSKHQSVGISNDHPMHTQVQANFVKAFSYGSMATYQSVKLYWRFQKIIKFLLVFPISYHCPTPKLEQLSPI